MDNHPPPNAELGVEPSPALVMEPGADTTVDSAPISMGTTAESVALSAETTTDSLALSSESAEDSLASDSSTKIDEIPIDDAEGKIELAAENTTVIVNLAVDSDYGIVDLASDGTPTPQSQSDPHETGAEELLTDCLTGIDRVRSRSSADGLVDLASDSDIETVNLATDSAMALEEQFGANSGGVVDLYSDEGLEIVELETKKSENLEESSGLPNVTLGSANNDSSTNGNIGQGPEGTNNVGGRRSNGNVTLGDSNSPDNSMGSRLNGPNDTLGPRNDGGPTDSSGAADNEQQHSSTDGKNIVDTRREGDTLQGLAPSSPRLPLNEPQPPQPRAWVQLLSPRWVALLLATWEASFRQLNTTMRVVGRQISAHWQLWNRVLIPLISGRGSSCCPRSLMIGMSTKACAPLAERRIVSEQNAGGDTLSVNVHESLAHIAIDILEAGSECTEGLSSVWSGGSVSSASNSWETMRGSSEESLSASSCSDLFDEDSDDDSEEVALNPQPIIEAPVEDLDNVDENEVCKVCYSRRIARKAFSPCGHAQLCAVCISGYERRHHCPICRRRIELILNIY